MDEGVSMDINLLTSLNDNIRIDRNKCTACGRCVEVCILDNLRLQLSPCRQACPVGMNCQGYIHHVAQGRMDKGLEKVKEAIPFGGILGRVCSRPCEAACNRLKVDGQAVAIRDLKRFLSDQDRIPPVPERAAEFPATVAIVGAGPAGLTAAFYLRGAGFKVTLFDRESEPGGLMRWGIPEFRLPLEILERELRFVKATGIDFRGNCTLGRDLDLQDLQHRFDAVLVAVGACDQVKLGIPGEDSPHVLPALEFLKKAREKKAAAPGNRVVVIGGGNAAMDAAQTALRMDARNVAVVCLEKREEMPAFPWSIAEAEEEGVSIHNGWGPQAFRFKEERLTTVSFRKCTALYDKTGQFFPAYDESQGMHLLCDTVIVAIGQRTQSGLVDPSWSRAGTIVCDPVTLRIEKSKVFVAGDFMKGPRTLVEAMGQGKEAAVSIERMLKGEDLHYERGNGKPLEVQFEPDWSRALKRSRIAMPTLPLARRKGFEEVARGLSGDEAVAEAERCLDCGLPFGLRTCWFCLPCEIECPEEALYVEVPYLLR
jgi:NADPH-dependent glutamate synthase beta subunit-like oxidoreductase